MTGLVIEGGIYFLLFFIPFAFGGVETWAQGVLQIVAGAIVAAWAWERLGRRLPSQRQAAPGAAALWIPMGLMVLLIAGQLVPMPPAWLARLSPMTHDMYAHTLPGYTEGLPFDSGALGSWIVQQEAAKLPGGSGSTQDAAVLSPPMTGSGFPLRATANRTLSIYPIETRQRLVILLCYIGLFAVVLDYFRQKERLGRLLAACVLSGFAVSVFGIIQRLTWNGKIYWVREGSYNEVFGPFVNRNSYAAFAGTLIPVAICMAFGARREMEKGRPDMLPRLLLWSFAAVINAGGVFLSLSRGGILSAGLEIAVVAALVFYYGRRGVEIGVLAALVLASAALLWWIGPEKIIERVGTLSQGQSIPSMASRLGAWHRSMVMIGDNPVFGTGLGTFRFAFLRYAPAGERWWTTAHNEYIELLCDTGLAGGFIFLAGFAAYLVRVARPASLAGRSGRYAYMGIVAGIAGLLFHSIVSSNLQVPAIGVLLVVLGAALLAVVWSQESGRSRVRKTS